MTTTDVRTLDAGRRVQVFLETQATALGKALPPSLRPKLDDAVTQLTAFQVEQGSAEGAATGETVNQAGLRDDLYQKFMVPVARAAKVALKSAPEFRGDIGLLDAVIKPAQTVMTPTTSRTAAPTPLTGMAPSRPPATTPDPAKPAA